MSHINLMTERIIGGAIAVHRVLGPGLLESTYEVCLTAELREQGLRVKRQVPVPVVYKGTRLEVGYRIDMLVERLVVVELKVAVRLEPVHTSQVLTYLRLANKPVGLLINFNVVALTQGVRRIVWGPDAPRYSSPVGASRAAALERMQDIQEFDASETDDTDGWEGAEGRGDGDTRGLPR